MLTSLNERKDFESDVILVSTTHFQTKFNRPGGEYCLYTKKKVLALEIFKSIDFTSNSCVLVSDESQQTSKCH